MHFYKIIHCRQHQQDLVYKVHSRIMMTRAWLSLVLAAVLSLQRVTLVRALCDACGASATYKETISTASGTEKR